MRRVLWSLIRIMSLSVVSLLVACAHNQTMQLAEDGAPTNPQYDGRVVTNDPRFNVDYSSRLPSHYETGGKKMVLVDPNVHSWGAYSADGNLVRAGIATAGGSVCPPDADEADCRTGRGTFHITRMGGEECASKVYPRPNGGGLMPYCMYFNDGQALHGSPDNIVVEDNISHGCVRMRIPDAEWLHNNFAQVGTKVVVMPY